MKRIFTISGILAVGMIFWAAISYLTKAPHYEALLWLALASIGLFLLTGLVKNRVEGRKFKEFLEAQRRDPRVQEKLRNEQLGKRGDAGQAKLHMKERKGGVEWMPANVHGAVARRKRKRGFLPKSR